MTEYLFVCVSCGSADTVQQSIKAPLTPPSCPDCKERMKLKMYPTATHFKGKGWARKNG